MRIITVFSYFIIYSFFVQISFSFYSIFYQHIIFNENHKNKIIEFVKIKFPYFSKYGNMYLRFGRFISIIFSVFLLLLKAGFGDGISNVY